MPTTPAVDSSSTREMSACPYSVSGTAVVKIRTMICVTTTTIVVRPRVARGFTRMYANAALKMSLSPNGRSGMTPGFSAGGGIAGG